MKSLYIYKMALRNISRNKKRTILSAIAIAVAVVLVCFMKSYTTGIWSNVLGNVYSFETGHIKIMNKDYIKEEKLMPLDLGIYGYDKDYTEVINLIKNIKGIKHVFPRTKFGALLNRDGKMKTLLGFALNPDLESSINPLKDKVIKGRIFKEFAPGRQELVIGKPLAEDLNLKVGDKITMMTKTAEEGLGHMTFKVVGLVSYEVGLFDKNYFYIPLSTAAKFLKMEDEVLELVIFLENKKDSIKISKQINKILEQNQDNPYEAYPWEIQKDGLYYNLLSLTKIYNIVYLVFLVLASLVIINTTMMVIYERMKEIGTIAALGMRGASIVKLFLYEAVIISAIGSFFGTIIGGAVSYAFSRIGIDIAKLTGGGMDMGFSERIYTYFSVELLIYSFIFGIIVASIFSFIPASRASRIEPVEAMKGVF